MSSGLENLTQHIFSHSGVESSHIERSLIRFGRGATGHVAWSTAARRHGVQAGVARQRRAHGGRDGIRVLRDHDRRKRRRGHVLLGYALVAIVTRGAAGGRGKITPRLLLVRHFVRMEVESQEAQTAKLLVYWRK
jgi:hypothetical protein